MLPVFVNGRRIAPNPSREMVQPLCSHILVSIVDSFIANLFQHTIKLYKNEHGVKGFLAGNAFQAYDGQG